MKTFKVFKKRGCSTVTLGKSDLLGFCVCIKDGKKVQSMFVYDTIHEALDMFWYCVAHESGISKYVK